MKYDVIGQIIIKSHFVLHANSTEDALNEELRRIAEIINGTSGLAVYSADLSVAEYDEKEDKFQDEKIQFHRDNTGQKTFHKLESKELNVQRRMEETE